MLFDWHQNRWSWITLDDCSVFLNFRRISQIWEPTIMADRMKIQARIVSVKVHVYNIILEIKPFIFDWNLETWQVQSQFFFVFYLLIRLVIFSSSKIHQPENKIRYIQKYCVNGIMTLQPGGRNCDRVTTFIGQRHCLPHNVPIVIPS